MTSLDDETTLQRVAELAVPALADLCVVFVREVWRQAAGAGVPEYLTAPSAVRAILEHLALPTRPAQLAAAQGPPQQAWC